jgi:hypothetical protein
MIYLNIPYNDRKIAKNLGGKWDAKSKKWYCEDENNELCSLYDIYKSDITIVGEDRDFGSNKLYIDMIPKTSYFNNVRSIFNECDWNLIRHYIYERVNNRCECCGRKRSKYLEAHERWEFNEETKTQKLVRIIALCKLCHSATHYGHSKRRKNMDNINMHIKKINNFTDEELQTHIKDAYKTWNERNKIKWELDFSIITNSGFEIKKSYV